MLARKYRPKQFSDIVGQQAVVRTLVNAIKLKRTHQAYVFSGSRGIGKTSIARIFSKALRCQNVVERDGLLYSCDQCSDCIEIAAGNSVSVLEIDGASNNGVDSVREIRENAKFLPTSGLYKIYIIDEVHMLSTAAFNALLKTLEEPPEHVVFIFATTESHKIPETILGRCQRFDFKRVTVAQITDRAKEVLKSEKIEFEDAAINLIARAAEGSMRDALSILDQVISFSGLKVTSQAVRESIGLIGTELVFGLLKNVLDRNAKDALSMVQNAFNQGVDLKILLKSMVEMLHALILMQVGIEKPETHFNDDELTQLKTLIGSRPLEEIELIFQVFHHGLDLLSRAAQPKLIFDLLMVKTALAESLVKIEEGEWKDNSASNPRRELRQEVVASPGDAYEGEGSPAITAPSPTPIQTPAKIEIKEEPQTPTQISASPLLHFSFHSDEKAQDQPKATATKTEFDPKGKTWEKFIELSFQKFPVLAIILESTVEWTLPQTANEPLRIGFRDKDKGKIDQLSQKQLRDQFLNLIEAYFGTRVIPELFVSNHAGESLAEKTDRVKKSAYDQRMNAILTNEIVQEAKALFGAELTQIEMTEKDG